jgi:ribosomal protein S27E
MASEPVTSRALQTRDEAGLTLAQKRLLAHLVEEIDWRKACEKAGVSVSQFRYMLRSDKAFQAAYKDLYKGVLIEARSHLTSLMPKVGQVFEEGLAANEARTVDVTCPECGHNFQITFQGPAWNVRLRVSEDLLKAQGDLAQKVIVEGEVKHRNLTLEDLLAQAILRRGGELPPQVEERLRQQGLEVTEGEYTVQSEGFPDTPAE